MKMVRNIDLAEAIIFYGDESLFDGDSLLDGVEYLTEECERDDTAVLAIVSAQANNKEVYAKVHLNWTYSQLTTSTKKEDPRHCAISSDSIYVR